MGTAIGVHHHSQAGFSLIEALCALGILVLAFAGFAVAFSTFGRFATHQAGPVRAAATVLAEQTLRVAQDAWKYGSPGLGPSGAFATAVPIGVPGEAPTTAPVAVSALVTGGPPNATIGITVRYTPEPNRKGDDGVVTISGALQVKAPVPGATILESSPVPQPSGAP